jgi:hypothetical protein
MKIQILYIVTCIEMKNINVAGTVGKTVSPEPNLLDMLVNSD